MNKCTRCGDYVYGDNFLCDDCRDEDNDEMEFTPCDKCDGHDACEDFGCAYELGVGRVVKKDIPAGSDDWS